jgi:Transposase DDE domain
LLQRIVHLRAVVAWAQVICDSAEFAAALPVQQQHLQQALTLACKVLEDRDDPEGKDQVRSVQDPDARLAKHGSFYVGYLVDVSMDADSQIITAMNVLAGGSNEGADAVTLIRQEEQTHGNDVQALSLDGAGYQGPLLHTLTDPQGLNLEVFVPPQDPPSQGGFPAEAFTLSEDQQTLTCPAGQTAYYRRRAWTDRGWQFYFLRATCAGCPLQSQCVPVLPQTRGRGVIKNDYEADYQAARAQAKTPAYEQVRREHPAIERKFAELVRRHGARRARYWRHPKVLLQQLLTGWVVNIKRVVKLLVPPEPTPEILRAAVLATG